MTHTTDRHSISCKCSSCRQLSNVLSSSAMLPPEEPKSDLRQRVEGIGLIAYISLIAACPILLIAALVSGSTEQKDFFAKAGATAGGVVIIAAAGGAIANLENFVDD